MLTLAKKMQHLVDLIVVKSPVSDKEERVRLNHYVWVTFMMLPITLIAGAYHASVRNYALTFLIVLFSAYLVTTLFLIAKTRKTYLLYFVSNVIFTVLMIYLLYHADFDASMILWLFTYPLGTIFLFGNRIGFMWSCVLLAIVIALFAWVPHVDHAYNLTFKIRFCFSYLAIAFITSWIEYHRHRYQHESEANREALLAEQSLLKEEIHRRTLLEEELHYLAQTDMLTKLYNRRHFLNCAHKEFIRAKRYGHDLAFALLDIDHFKHINDSLGHPVGDVVLQTLGEYCVSQVRDTDIIGRLGGEELAFLLLHVNEEKAKEKMEHLRIALSRLRITYTQGIEPLNITASIGVASITSEVQSFEDLYLRADKKLYEAKSAGRNCVR